MKRPARFFKPKGDFFEGGRRWMEEHWRSEHVLQIAKMVKCLCARVTLNIHEFFSNAHALFPRSSYKQQALCSQNGTRAHLLADKGLIYMSNCLKKLYVRVSVNGFHKARNLQHYKEMFQYLRPLPAWQTRQILTNPLCTKFSSRARPRSGKTVFWT